VPKAVNRSGCSINTTAHSAIRSRDLAHCSQAPLDHCLTSVFAKQEINKFKKAYIVETMHTCIHAHITDGEVGVRVEQVKRRTCNHGHVVHTRVPLSPSSIIWERPQDVDAMQLER